MTIPTHGAAKAERLSHLDRLEPRRLFAGVSAAEVVVDNSAAQVLGDWAIDRAAGSALGGDLLHDRSDGRDGKSVLYRASLSGRYDVFARWTAAPWHAPSVAIDVTDETGTTTLHVNQQADGGQWVRLGAFDFDLTRNAMVRIRNDHSSGYVVADAVKFSPSVDPAAAPAVAATAETSDCVTVSWPAVEGAVHVLRCTSPGFESGVTRFDLAGGVTQFTDERLAASTRYHYRVYASSAAGATPTLIGEASATTPDSDDAAVDITIDNRAARLVGRWSSSTQTPGYQGPDHLHDRNDGVDGKSVLYSTSLEAGRYEVFATWPAAPWHAGAVPIDVTHAEGTTTVFVDQRKGGGQWMSLGTYRFDSSANVRIRNDYNGGYVIADAVRLVSARPLIAPATPTDVRAMTLSHSQVEVAWTDQAENESGFVVERSSRADFSADVVKVNLPADRTRFVAGGLSAMTTYYFRVRAIGAGGESALSAVDFDTTHDVRVETTLVVGDDLQAVDTPRAVHGGDGYRDITVNRDQVAGPLGLYSVALHVADTGLVAGPVAVRIWSDIGVRDLTIDPATAVDGWVGVPGLYEISAPQHGVAVSAAGVDIDLLVDAVRIAYEPQITVVDSPSDYSNGVGGGVSAVDGAAVGGSHVVLPPATDPLRPPATFAFAAPGAGEFDVFVRWRWSPFNTTAAMIDDTPFDQRASGDKWVYLGRRFFIGDAGTVTFSNTSLDGAASADAVMFVDRGY